MLGDWNKLVLVALAGTSQALPYANAGNYSVGTCFHNNGTGTWQPDKSVCDASFGQWCTGSNGPHCIVINGELVKFVNLCRVGPGTKISIDMVNVTLKKAQQTYCAS